MRACKHCFYRLRVRDGEAEVCRYCDRCEHGFKPPVPCSICDPYVYSTGRP